jgi:hypothetical protein
MTLLSLSECCRLLAIDAKPLHRWLAQAQLSLHAHPTDARTRGLTPAQLRLLASTHHRRLPALPGELPTLASGEALALPPDLLDLLALLRTLPEHLAALQQQLADLRLQLPQPACTPTSGPKTPTRSRHKATAEQKSPQSPTPVLARVEATKEGGYVVIDPKEGLLALEPDTPAWFAWLAEHSSFRFVGKGGRFTAHHAWRVPHGAWRAHRHIRNHSYTLRLAPTQELTIAVLEQAAEALQAHLQ